MARTLNRLSTLKVTRAKRPGMHADGGCLYLRVATGGSRQWIFRYTAGGRLRDMGLGSVSTFSLSEARERARDARKLLADGIDPISAKRARSTALLAADAKAMTFAQCATAYIASHEAGWSNALHRSQWTNTLTQHVHPVIGPLPVAAIDTALVMRTLEPIWTKIPETAARVRGRIEAILDWARVSGFRAGENPARWRGHLDHLLPAKSRVQKIEHHAALAYTQVGEFMAKLRKRTGVSARVLELLTLTAGRLGEVRGATWPEIDLAAKVWVVPGGRMKSGKEHRVPLSPPAVAVLHEMAAIRESDHVFPGVRGPIGGSAPLMLMKELTGTTVHGLRSTFRDWAAERTNFPREVAELALAHAVGSDVERAYQRGDLFEKRRALMGAWAQYCAAVEKSESKVVPISAMK